MRRRGKRQFTTRLEITTLLKWTYAVVFVISALQLYRWQVIYHDKFSEIGKIYVQAQRRLINERGSIYTKDGITIATDRITWEPYISVVHEEEYQKLVEKWPTLRKHLKSIADIDLPEEPPTLKKVAYYPLKKQINEETKLKLQQAFKKDKIIGVYFKEQNRRFYPLGDFASHVLGFVQQKSRDEAIGVYGIEGYFWPEISGRKGEIIHEKDITGRILSAADYKRFVLREGKNIVLTIDSKIQQKVEEILAKKVEEYQAKSGTVIVMDPKTGAILAMANYPNYDPNFYFEVTDYSVFKNKAVSDPYEYGSVQKPLTLAIALEEGAITPDYTCYDTGVLEVLDKKIYNFRRRKYGLLDITGILLHSDNVCSATVALKLTPEQMYTYLQKLGIGTVFNIGLQDEETSFIKPLNKWNKVDLAVSAFGQMISATPLQIISAHSALANNGVRMQPYIIKEIYDSEEKIQFKPYAAAYVFSSQTVKTITKAMADATMSRALFKKYKGKVNIAGKTGTSQIPNPEGTGYLEDAVNTTFVGFAPAEDAKVIMLVKFEQPQTHRTGSTTAAPTWVEIFDAIAPYLGIIR